MQNKIISKGKTTNEAIENGLKQLGVTKKDVDIKVLEEEKKSFFDILAPRVVKVEMALKEVKKEHREDKEIIVSENDLQIALNNVDSFLKELVVYLKEIEYTINNDKNSIYIKIAGDKASEFIGYRGETLDAFQTIISSVANKNTNSKVRVILDILYYKEKRKESLERLARKVEKTVIKNGNPFKLEPMNAYERKIIHTALQDSAEVTTNSIGEEPYRRVIIRKK